MLSSVSTDPRLMQMFNVQMSEAVVDYFVDRLTTAVARATIAQPYKAAFELKTYSLMFFVHTMISTAQLDMQVVMTAIVYLDRMRIDELWAYGDELICERLAVGAFKAAHKWIFDECYRYEKWTVSSRFSRQDVDVMERHFLRLIDYRCWASPGAYLEHYAPLMQYVGRLDARRALTQRASVFPPRKPEEPRIFLPEPEGEPEVELAYGSTSKHTNMIESVLRLPDLTYPESDSAFSSPMSMSDDDFDAIFSSDDELSSEDSPEAVTPPDAAREHDAHPAAPPGCPSSTTLLCTDARAEAPTRQQAQARALPVPFLLQKPGVADAEMDARSRFYAADHGTVVYSCHGSPQFVPPSPSNMLRHELKQSQGPGGTQPWHQMQAWRSTSLSGNTTWGTLGLFAS